MRARLGDLHAFDALVARHRRAVWAYATNVLGDPDAADDVAQEVFLRAWRSLDSFDAGRALWPWLQAITNRLCIDELRAVARRVHVPLDESSPAQDFAPATIAALDRRRALRAPMRAMSTRHRDLFWGQAVEGRSHADLARTDGSSTGAVAKALVRARAHVREALGPAGEFLGALPPVVWLRRALDRAGPAGPAAERMAAAFIAVTLVFVAPLVEPAERRRLVPAVATRPEAAVGSRLPVRAPGSNVREAVRAPADDGRSGVSLTVEGEPPRDGGAGPQRVRSGVALHGPDGTTWFWYEGDTACDSEGEPILPPGGPVRTVC